MNTSVWWEAVPESKPFPPLAGDTSADVLVVGGGITGITTAYLLAKAGKKVVLIEKDRIGRGDTGYTTAFVTELFDSPLTKITKTFNEETAKRVWQSGRLAIEQVEKIVTEEKIDCDYSRCDAYVVAADEEGWKHLEEEQALSEKLGFASVLKQEKLSFPSHGYQHWPNQAKFHPIKYLLAVTARCVAMGVAIHEDTHAHDVETKDGKTVAFTNHGKITATHAVIATHAPINNKMEIPARQKASMTYVIEGTVPKGSVAEGLYMDTKTPYHYFRVDGDRLIFGGEDHATGVMDVTPAEHFNRLEATARRWFPQFGEIKHHWSGEVFESSDGLPFIGPSLGQPSQFVISGLAGNGMTFGTFGAMLARDAIMGKENPYAATYTLKRFKSWKNMMMQGMEIMKHFFGDRSKASHEDLANMQPETGRIVKEKGEMVAVYKDAKGELKKCSAVCTHMRCLVQWNGSEKTWDCPCHGSRFKTDGSVLTGPANEPLARKD